MPPNTARCARKNSLDWPKLQAYLREHDVPGADTAMEVKQFRGGSSNLTYLLRFADGHQWVVRRPPFGPLPPSAHDMAREYRVLSRLWEGFAAAPRAIVLCEDPSIIGAVFFVMERREGAVIKNRHPLPPEIDAKPETFRRISESLIDTLADLHAADYEKIGLGGLGRPEGFLQRQITGWMGRWEKAKTREVPLMEKLGTWFLEHMPAAQKPVLLHNDFYLHNVMFKAGDSGKVVGVFDWEMSTLGDPMIDLGLTIGYWRAARRPGRADRAVPGLCAYHGARLPEPRRAAPALCRAQRSRREHGGLLPGVGQLEDRDRGRADLRPLRARADQRSALCQHGRVGAGAGAPGSASRCQIRL